MDLSLVQVTSQGRLTFHKTFTVMGYKIKIIFVRVKRVGYLSAKLHPDAAAGPSAAAIFKNSKAICTGVGAS